MRSAFADGERLTREQASFLEVASGVCVGLGVFYAAVAASLDSDLCFWSLLVAISGVLVANVTRVSRWRAPLEP